MSAASRRRRLSRMAPPSTARSRPTFFVMGRDACAARPHFLSSARWSPAGDQFFCHDSRPGCRHRVYPSSRYQDRGPVVRGSPWPKNPGGLQDSLQPTSSKEIANGTVKKEDLGTQTINGVAAQGTRYALTDHSCRTDRQRQTHQRRYRALVLGGSPSGGEEHADDPRFGSTTYTLTNIQRQEPAATPAAVPSDYTVRQGHAHGKGNMRYGPAGQAPAGVAPPPPGD